MRKYLLILFALVSLSTQAQLPTPDSLLRYNDQYIRNSAITAFTNNRLNTLLKGIIENLANSGGGGGGTILVQLRTTPTHIQYKYSNQSDFFWQNLIALSELRGDPGPTGPTGPVGAPGATGPQGDPGPSVEIGHNLTHLQYRQIGTGTWVNIIPLDSLKGPQGPPGGGGGGGSSVWGAITGSILDQLDLQTVLAGKQPLGAVYYAGVATALGSVNVPNTMPLLRTSGYSVAGIGSALYKRDTVNGPETRFRFQSGDGTWWTLADQRFTPRMFGAIGDSTDATDAIQAALDYTRSGTGRRKNTGSVLDFSEGGMYLISKLTVHSGNNMSDSRVAGMGGFNYTNGNGAALIHIQGSIPADSFMIVTDMNAGGWQINGLQIVGGSVGNSTSRQGGIRVYSGVGGNANSWTISNNVLKGWGIEAIWAGGSPFYILNNMVQGVNNRQYVTERALTGGLTRETGAARLFGVDGTIRENEFTGAANQNSGGAFAVSDLNRNASAAHFGQLNLSHMTNNIYQVGDAGLRAPGGQNVYTGERFDTNAGEGLYMTNGSDNTFVGCQFVRNGLGATNTYDGIYVGDGIRNTFRDPQFGAGADIGGQRVRYFINDQKTNLNPNLVNQYLNIRAYDTAGTDYISYNQGSDVWGPMFTIENTGVKRLTSTFAAPSVYGRKDIVLFNATNTTYVNFVRGFPGQILVIYGSTAGGGTTTLQHSASGSGLRLASGTTYVPTDFKPIMLQNKGNWSTPVWVEINGASAVVSGGGGTDQPARDSITAFKNRQVDTNTVFRQAIDLKVQSVVGVTANGLTANNGGTAVNRAISFSVDGNSLGNNKLAQVGQSTFKGRVTAGTGNVEDLTATQATSILNTFTSSLKGLVPSGGSNTTVLYGDGTWGSPSGSTSFLDPGSNGIMVRTSTNNATPRTIVAENGQVTVVNGNGVSGNPTIGIGTGVAASKIGAGVVDDTEYGYLNNASSNIQAQIDALKADSTVILADSMPTANSQRYPTSGGTKSMIDSLAAIRAPLASPAFTGTPTAPTASAATSTTQLATTAFVTTADNLKANIASPTFTGTPAAPTAAGGTNTTQLATTAFVQAALTPASSSAAGVMTVNQYNRLFTRQTSANPTGTITVNVNSGAQIGITFTATGGRTLAFLNLVAGDLVKIVIDNTSGSTVALTLPSNSFSAGTGSAASVTIPTGKSVLSLVDYDGTNYYFSLQSY